VRSLRILVADDEPLAREALLLELRRRGEVERLVSCASGHEAIAALRSEEIDLAFLDVRMPEVSGFEVVRRIGVERMPPVVFVTAFDRFAVEAFEVRALDYLLKPVSRERFGESFARALAAVRGRSAERDAALRGLLEEAAQEAERLRIKTGERTTIVRLDEIVWIEAASSYVRVHTRESTHLLRASLGSLEERLDPERFLRVHRSAIVHLDCVRELRHVVRGDYDLLLSNGDRVRASRRRRAELVRRLDERAI